jgi:hypothetical protein
MPWPSHSPDMIPLNYFLWGHLNNVVYASAMDIAEKLLQRLLNDVSRSATLLAFLSASVYQCIIWPKLVWQRKATILTI